MKHLLRLLVLSFCLLSLAWSSAAPAAPRPNDPTLGPFLHRELAFNISFLWFDQLAEAHFRMLPTGKPNTFRAVLEARTLGLAAWLTGDRIQRYEAVMRRDAKGMFHSQTYSSTIYRGNGKQRRGRTKLYTYDYAQRQIEVTIERNGVVTPDEVLPMVDGDQPSDVLTAFFNFYTGVYGDLKPGETLKIPTFSRDGGSQIEVSLVNPSARPKGFPTQGKLCRIKVDQEVFDTGGGYVYVWFDSAGVPEQGMIEDVLGMGDVRGTLR